MQTVTAGKLQDRQQQQPYRMSKGLKVAGVAIKIMHETHGDAVVNPRQRAVYIHAVRDHHRRWSRRRTHRGGRRGSGRKRSPRSPALIVCRQQRGRSRSVSTASDDGGLMVMVLLPEPSVVVSTQRQTGFNRLQPTLVSGALRTRRRW